MTDKQIIIEDYFNIMRDDYGRIYCIQDIGDPRELIKAIREQNEYIQRKEQECEELKQGYAELTEIVSPYMDDFTGYNEELGGFDIVLCVKELMKQLDQLKAENEKLKNFHINLVGVKECEIRELARYKQAVEKIKEIIHFNKTNRLSGGADISITQILQICDEVVNG